ncbi:hypothetical protein ACFWGN_14290 [Oerskovia sp. NPDC060338]|uniref:hypothetical protein n=1 Tax=Oerskovia sp. NPDC060338 TaxID=3347100 RepID=UPI003667CBFA
MTSTEVGVTEDEILWADGAVTVRYLAAGTVNRDAEFVDFVETHGGRLRRIAFLISGDHHRAEGHARTDLSVLGARPGR